MMHDDHDDDDGWKDLLIVMVPAHSHRPAI